MPCTELCRGGPYEGYIQCCLIGDFLLKGVVCWKKNSEKFPNEKFDINMIIVQILAQDIRQRLLEMSIFCPFVFRDS